MLIIIGLPLALFGTILRVLAVMMGKKDFTFVRPRTATRVPSLQDEEDVYAILSSSHHLIGLHLKSFTFFFAHLIFFFLGFFWGRVPSMPPSNLS